MEEHKHLGTKDGIMLWMNVAGNSYWMGRIFETREYATTTQAHRFLKDADLTEAGKAYVARRK